MRYKFNYKISLIIIGLIIISLLIVLVMASNVINFDYNTGAGTSNVITQGTSTFPPAWGIGGTAIGSNYTNVLSNNTMSYSITDLGSNFEGFVKMNFTINVTEANVKWMYWELDVNSSYVPPEDADCYIGNFDLSQWEKICDMPLNKGSCNYNITSSVGSYIDANGQVLAVCAGQNLDLASDITIDYVRLSVYNETAVDPCVYTSGNWEVNCTKYCNITTNIDGGATGNNFTATGSGRFMMTGNISGFKNYKFGGGCNATCSGGGCIRI